MAAKGEREVRVRFTGESAVLKGAGGEVRKVFQMMKADINDTRDAAEKMAAAQSQVADSMRKDMAAIATAADVVRDSLGPEMVAAIESSGVCAVVIGAIGFRLFHTFAIPTSAAL